MKKTSLKDFKKAKKLIFLMDLKRRIRNADKSEEWGKVIKYIQHHEPSDLKAFTWSKI